jgi:cyclic dehypoxanthinyl futalosine synthase
LLFFKTVDMQLADLYKKASQFEFLSIEEGMFLFEHAPLAELMFVANEMKKHHVPHGKVTWQIDRNVNTTNVCIANCKFCNFYRIPGHAEAYITDMPTYRTKIEETIQFGGDQLLLQGGHHPELGLDFYTKTFRAIKQEYPTIKLHALDPRNCTHYKA